MNFWERFLSGYGPALLGVVLLGSAGAAFVFWTGGCKGESPFRKNFYLGDCPRVHTGR